MKACLTGGIACGKSLLSRYLSELGVEIIDADDVVHSLIPAEERRRLADQIDYPVSAILPNEYLLISTANSGKMPDGIDFNSTIAKKFELIASELMYGGAR